MDKVVVFEVGAIDVVVISFGWVVVVIFMIFGPGPIPKIFMKNYQEFTELKISVCYSWPS